MDTGYTIFFQDSDGNYVYSIKYDGDPETVYGNIMSSLNADVFLYDIDTMNLIPQSAVTVEAIPDFINHISKTGKVEYDLFSAGTDSPVLVSPSKQYINIVTDDVTGEVEITSGSIGDRIINVNIQDLGYFDAELIGNLEGSSFFYRLLKYNDSTGIYNGFIMVFNSNNQIISIGAQKILYPFDKDPDYYRLYDTSWQNVMTERLEFSNGGPSMPVFTFDVANAQEISSSGQTTYYRCGGTRWSPSEFSGETGSDFILRVINYGETNYGRLTTGSSSTIFRGHEKSTYDGVTFVSFESDDEFQITMLSSLHLIYDPTRFGNYWVIGKYDEEG